RWMINENNALLWLLGIPLLASPLIYLLGRISVRVNALKPYKPTASRQNPASWLALITLLVSFIPLAAAAQAVINHGRARSFIGGIPMVMDGISLVLAATA